jgi:hypothetical protein
LSSRTSLLDHSRRVPIFFTAIFHLRLSCLVEALTTWAMVEFRSNRKINNQQRPHGISLTTASLAFRESCAIHALRQCRPKKSPFVNCSFGAGSVGRVGNCCAQLAPLLHTATVERSTVRPVNRHGIHKTTWRP